MLRVLVLALAVFAAGCDGCGRGYSEGDRSGVITKFSYKGLACKSWEGEMNLGGTSAGENGAVPTTWKFTVTSPALVPGFQAAVSSGKRATVHYAQYAVAPVCNDTDYEATAVTTVP